MKAYRLVNKNNEEIIFGVKNDKVNYVLSKLNNGTRKIRPYNYCITYPYWVNPKPKFAFLKLNGFKYFLFSICKFDLTDIEELKDLGYYVEEQELGTYGNGLSKLFCTYFDDEIVELKNVELTELFASTESMAHESVNLENAPSDDIKYCKNKYYKNVKFIN